MKNLRILPDPEKARRITRRVIDLDIVINLAAGVCLLLFPHFIIFSYSFWIQFFSCTPLVTYLFCYHSNILLHGITYMQHALHGQYVMTQQQ